MPLGSRAGSLDGGASTVLGVYASMMHVKEAYKTRSMMMYVY